MGEDREVVLENPWAAEIRIFLDLIDRHFDKGSVKAESSLYSYRRLLRGLYHEKTLKTLDDSTVNDCNNVVLFDLWACFCYFWMNTILQDRSPQKMGHWRLCTECTYYLERLSRMAAWSRKVLYHAQLLGELRDRLSVATGSRYVSTSSRGMSIVCFYICQFISLIIFLDYSLAGNFW